MRKFIERIWANAAAPANKVGPTTGKQDAGWTVEKPPFENMNWAWEIFTSMLQNAEHFGIMEWITETEYPLRGLATGSNGVVYRSQVANNQGNDPTTDNGTNWKPWFGEALDHEYVPLTAGTLPLSNTSSASGNTDYVYNLADFVGTGLVTSEIREIYVEASVTTNNGNDRATGLAKLPDETFTVITDEVVGAGANQVGGSTLAVPINKGQPTLTLRATQVNGEGSVTLTVRGARQRVFA